MVDSKEGEILRMCKSTTYLLMLSFMIVPFSACVEEDALQGSESALEIDEVTCEEACLKMADCGYVTLGAAPLQAVGPDKPPVIGTVSMCVDRCKSGELNGECVVEVACDEIQGECVYND